MSIESPGGNDMETVSIADRQEPQPIGSKLEAYGWALVRWWGGLFRAIFISLIGVIGYLWADPQFLGDIPFAELTLNHILRNLFAVFIVLGCIKWFFDFPDQSSVESPEDDPYVTWGEFGGGLLLVGFLVMHWFDK